jgi:hypothetical protein
MLSDLVNKLRGQGDPLADAALADYQNASLDTQALLEQGMRQGVSKVGNMPHSFRQLLQDSEAAVHSISAAQLDLAMQPYAWIGPTWLSIALGPGALAHTYSDPGIAAVLMRTGKLLPQTVSRRLLETQLWTISVIRPGGMGIGGAGYVSTLQVRLLHARVRASLMQRGWRSPDGHEVVPIDQLQMLRTWLDFTVVPFEAWNRIGFALSAQQMQRLYAAWRLVGHLLGLDAALLATVTDHTVGQAFLSIVDKDLPAPDENSRVLTKAMLDAIGARLAPVLKLPVDVSTLLMASLCRLFQGDDLAGQLDVQANWTSALLPMMVDANRFRFAQIVDEAHVREATAQQSLRAFEAIQASLSDATAYQSISHGLSKL